MICIYKYLKVCRAKYLKKKKKSCTLKKKIIHQISNDVMTHTHKQTTHIPAPQVCVHIPPVLRVFPPAVTHVIPLSLEGKSVRMKG